LPHCKPTHTATPTQVVTHTLPQSCLQKYAGNKHPHTTHPRTNTHMHTHSNTVPDTHPPTHKHYNTQPHKQPFTRQRERLKGSDNKRDSEKKRQTYKRKHVTEHKEVETKSAKSSHWTGINNGSEKGQTIRQNPSELQDQTVIANSSMRTGDTRMCVIVWANVSHRR